MTVYAFVIFVHVLAVAALVGTSLAVDFALSLRKKKPSAGLDALLASRLRPFEAGAAVIVLVFGLLLLSVNPQGMALMKSGGWVHMKLSFGLLAPVLLLLSRSGEGKSWERPLRGVAQLCMIGAIFAVKFLRLL